MFLLFNPFQENSVKKLKAITAVTVLTLASSPIIAKSYSEKMKDRKEMIMKLGKKANDGLSKAGEELSIATWKQNIKAKFNLAAVMGKSTVTFRVSDQQRPYFNTAMEDLGYTEEDYIDHGVVRGKHEIEVKYS